MKTINPSSVTREDVKQAVEHYLQTLNSAEFEALRSFYLLNVEEWKKKPTMQDYFIDAYSEFIGSYSSNDKLDFEELENAITEQADSLVHIYNYDLFEWAKKGYGYIEDAQEEYGSQTDIIKAIQTGEYKMLYDFFYFVTEKLKETITGKDILIREIQGQLKELPTDLFLSIANDILGEEYLYEQTIELLYDKEAEELADLLDEIKTLKAKGE